MSFVCALFGAAAGWPATLPVGPGKQYSMPCAAIAAARAGDLIEIDASGTYDGDVCTIRTANLTLRGIGGRAHIRAAGRKAGGKGIWVASAAGIVVENIEFSGARVPDRNGAGIRVDTPFGLTARNCHFHDNETGILTGNSPAADVVVEYSIFENNGSGDGQSHNLYVNHARKFVFRGNYSARSRVGHLVKSRAAENYILYNRVSQESSDGSYEIDLPNGGRSYIIGNIIQQGAASQNSAMVAFKLEGANPANPNDDLFVSNNTILNQRASGSFIVLGASVQTPAVVRNNIFVGPGTVINRPTAVVENNITGDPGFTDLAAMDLRLRPGSRAINAGSDPGSGAGFSLTPVAQYVHPACEDTRTAVGALDLGAYEFGGGSAASGLPSRCAPAAPAPLAALHGASFEAVPSAPGAVLSVFGAPLALELVAARTLPLPTSLGGVTANVNGVAAPLFFVSPTQVNIQVPYETPAGEATLLLRVDGTDKPPLRFTVAGASPGIFLLPSTNRAVAQNQDYSLNAQQNPAPPGSVLIVYLTGQGALDTPVASGAAAGSDPLARAALPARATIGGIQTQLLFLGMTPGLVALLQANLVVPDLPPGDHPLVVTIANVASNAALVSIGPPAVN